MLLQSPSPWFTDEMWVLVVQPGVCGGGEASAARVSFREGAGPGASAVAGVVLCACAKC